MVKNIKFHSFAITIIVVVIVFLYLLIGPEAPAPVAAGPAQPSDRYVRIVSATWGKNCDEFIDTAIKSRDASPPPKDANGNVIMQKPLEHVKIDNALDVVKTICEGKPACMIPANTQAMAGIDPLEVCYKKLAVSYRCFDLDRLSTDNADQGQAITIDCTVAPQNASAPTAAHP